MEKQYIVWQEIFDNKLEVIVGQRACGVWGGREGGEGRLQFCSTI